MKGKSIQFNGPDSDPQWESKDAYDEQSPYSTGEEVSSATSRLGWDDTAVGLLARYSSMRTAESNGAQKLSPEQANSQYPGMPTPFREPVNPVVAQMLYDREQNKNTLARSIQNGPQDWWQKTKNFGTGLMVHAMDPLEFGVGMVTGWGVGGALTKTAYGARLAAGAGTSLTSRLALNTIEAASGNLVQNSAQELANAGVSDMEGIKYDPVEGMKNVALGTLMGTVMGVGIKEGSWRMTRFLKGTSPEADLAVVRSAQGQYEAGLKPDVAPLLTSLARETDVKPSDFPGKFDYEYQPVQGETELKGKSFYIPADGVEKFNPDNARMIGEQHGNGVQLTDNPGVANAAAARSMADAPGHVFEVDGAQVKPFNLEATIPEDLKPAFLKAMGGAIGDASEQIEKASGKDIMSSIMNAIDEGDLEPKVIGELQSELKAKGFNAFVQDGSNVAGVSHSPHNLLTVFDGEPIEPKGFMQADPTVRNAPTDQALRDVIESRNDPNRLMSVDEQTLRAGEDLVREADVQGLEHQPIDDQEFFDQFKSMEDQGLLDPALAAEVEKIQGLDSEFKFKDRLMKAVIGCVYG